MPSGSSSRAKRAAIAGQYTERVPFTQLRGADLAYIGVAESAGDLYVSLLGNIITLQGRTPVNTTEVGAAWFEWTAPPHFKSNSPIWFDFYGNYAGTGTGSATFDVNAYIIGADGTGGSADIVETAAQAIGSSAGVSTLKTDATNYTPKAGDRIMCKFTISTTETGASNPIQVTGTDLALRYYVTV